jgi:hypothetical protein
MKKILTFFVLFVLCSSSVLSQVEDRFAALTQKNVELYAQPFATAFGTAMNSGGYHSASVADWFGFSISFQGMYMLIPDDDLTFTPSLPDGYTAGPTATIFGDKGSAYAGPAGYITTPPGVNVSAMPMAMPQISVSLLGTEVLFRYLPEIEIGDSGEKLSMLGLGAKHSISRYIPLIPIDIAVQVLYNKLEITDLLESKNLAFNAHVSKTLGVFIPYFGLQYESSSLDLNYTIKGDPASGDPELRTDKEVGVSLDGDNTFRTTLGAALKLAVFVLNADVNLGAHTTFTGGLSFEF